MAALDVVGLGSLLYHRAITALALFCAAFHKILNVQAIAVTLSGLMAGYQISVRMLTYWMLNGTVRKFRSGKSVIGCLIAISAATIAEKYMIKF